MIKLVSLILCFCLLSRNLAAAHERGAVELSPQDMQRLLSDPKVQRQYLLLAQNEAPEAAVKKAQEKKKKEDEEKAPEVEEIHEERESAINFFGNLNIGGGGGKEWALIAFAVIGIVVVVAWVPYFPVLLYDSFSGKKELERIHQFSIQHVLTTSAGENESLRYGSLSGGRYSLFLQDPQNEDSWATLGFTAEGGYYRFKDEAGPLSHRVEGAYWLLGPAILFGAADGEGFPLFAKLDLLAGTSFDSNLGLVSRADLTLGSYLFNTNMSANLGIGGLYLNSKKNHGIINNDEQFGFIFSAGLGYSF